MCTHLQDRFATARALPPIDAQQDWCLVEGEEEDEFTILEFSRNYTTCDEYDLTIQVTVIVVPIVTESHSSPTLVHAGRHSSSDMEFPPV